MAASAPDTKSSRTKVRDYRARLRARGLRPIQIWAPDVRAPEFRRQAHLQSAAAARSDQAHDDQAFIDSISDLRFDDGDEG
ncbi:MAG: DUF3018 family protein [Salinarimonadaceae bacterium]|nr:MAG: DUF3018 family protein [Salinarimonadaceae bacterium]